MRRIIPLFLVLALVAAACGDDADTADELAPSTTPSPSTTTTTTTTTTATTVIPTTVIPQGMCGDLVPVVTDDGTLCLDPDAPPPASLPPADLDGLAPVVIADGRSITRYEIDENGQRVAVPMPDAAFVVTAIDQAPSGRIVTREYDPDDPDADDFGPMIAVYDGDDRREIDGLIDLFDVAVIDGVEVAIGPDADPATLGRVIARSLDDGAVIADFDLGYASVFSVFDFDWHEGLELGVYTAFADLTEEIGFVDRAGEFVELPSPTRDLAYNAPPFVAAAAFSEDGSEVIWAEGPDWGYDPEIDDYRQYPQEWVIRSADLRTGEERVWWPITEPVADVSTLSVERIEDIGGRWFITLASLDGTEPVFHAPLVLDMTGEEPELTTSPEFGIATSAR